MNKKHWNNPAFKELNDTLVFDGVVSVLLGILVVVSFFVAIPNYMLWLAILLCYAIKGRMLKVMRRIIDLKTDDNEG
jgi:hypothetical protein